MRDLTTTLLFGWYPYLVLAVFALGCWLRFDGAAPLRPRAVLDWLRNREVLWGAGLFVGGVSALFIGHFVGLLTPIAVFDALGISHSFKQTMAIVLGGIAGSAGIIGVGWLAYRVLSDARIRAAVSLGDFALLLMIFAQLSLGLGSILVSLKYLDGCAMLKFMSWAQGILTLKPGVAALIAGVPLIFKLHLFLGMSILLVFPFTRAVILWAVPLRYFDALGSRRCPA